MMKISWQMNWSLDSDRAVSSHTRKFSWLKIVGISIETKIQTKKDKVEKIP